MARVKDSQTLNASAHPSAGFFNGLHDGWPSSGVIGRLRNISQKRRHYFFQRVLRIKKKNLSQRPAVVFPSCLRGQKLHHISILKQVSSMAERWSWLFSEAPICVKENEFSKVGVTLARRKEKLCGQYFLLSRDGSCHWPMAYALRCEFWGRRKEKRFGRDSEVI